MTGIKTIRWTPSALRDFEEIAAYYRLNNPALERQTGAAIYDGITSLAEFPRKGRPTQNKHTRRWFIADTPYTVTYRLKDTAIQIVRVRHGARKPLKQ